MARVAALGCIVCRNEGFGHSQPTLHHVRIRGAKTDNMKVIPLCPPHHLQQFGPDAFHFDSRGWQERFGTQEELLEQIRELLD